MKVSCSAVGIRPRAASRQASSPGGGPPGDPRVMPHSLITVHFPLDHRSLPSALAVCYTSTASAYPHVDGFSVKGYAPIPRGTVAGGYIKVKNNPTTRNPGWNGTWADPCRSRDAQRLRTSSARWRGRSESGTPTARNAPRPSYGGAGSPGEARPWGPPRG
jgi:hypothetical protein